MINEAEYIEITCKGCQTVIAFTPAEIVELRSNHELNDTDEIEILNCPRCSSYVCPECNHEGHA